MWRNWTSGILGLWLVLTVFLNFSSTLARIVLVVTSLAIAILNFWAASGEKSPKNF